MLSFYATSIYAEFLGGKWENSTVYWKKDSSLPSSYSTPVRFAALKWNNIGNIGYTEKLSGTFQVSVERLIDPYFEQQGYYGFGIPMPEGGPFTEGWLYIITENVDSLNDHDKQNMITHEFGHILGLAHTKDGIFNPIKSIMDEGDVFDSDVYGPTEYDENNISTLY